MGDVETIKMQCSNCSKFTIFEREEVKKVFPFSREILKCRHCLKPLSICGGFYG